MMKQYEEYIESGVEWIGELPNKWQLVKLKHLVDMKSGNFISAENIDIDGNYPVYGGNGLRGYCAEFTHDGFFPLIGRQGALCGNINYANGKFWATEHAVVVSPKKDLEIFWLGELLRLMNLNQYSQASAQPGLSVEKILNLPIPLPTSEEQTIIAQYLDYQTAIIDQLIQQKEKLIELLKEKRQAVINEAVTKGLDPTVKMKDSGIEWLGEVPEEWEIKSLKYFTIKEKGVQTGPFGTQLNTKDYVDAGVKVFNQKTLIDENYEAGEEFISEEKFSELNVFDVIPGDIIMGTRGSFGTKNRTTFGKCSIVPQNTPKAVLHPCLIRIRLNTNMINKEYFKYYVNDSSYFLEEISNTSNSTTIEVIYGTTLKDIKFLVPPIHEQELILSFLNKKTSEIDVALSLEFTQIAKFKEYRQSIISEAVTGKIDVRDWQPPNQ